jgi:hypothetical protein
MTLNQLRKRGIQLHSPQYQAARLAIKGLSQVLIANELGISASAVGLLIEEAEAVLGEKLPRTSGLTSHAHTPELVARHRRRLAKKAEMPDVDVAPGTIETCGFCGLRWHSEDWPNGQPRCDLKIRRLHEAYIGSALGAET